MKRNLPRNNSCQAIREHSYRQLILPVLNYCSTIWDPYHHNATNQIEMIQHRAARFVLNRPWRRYHLDSMTRMLTELQWPTLQTLRSNARLILLYKLIHHHQFIPNQYLPIPAFPIIRANHHFKFQHYTSRTTMYRNSFFPRTIPEWNKLPSTIVESNNLNLFKRNLSNYNM